MKRAMRRDYSTYTETVTIEIEGDDKRIGLITQRSSFKRLSPELQALISREISEGRELGLLVEATFDLICYPGEDAIYYPNDRAYPGSDPYADADLSLAESHRIEKEGAGQMHSRFWMAYSPKDDKVMYDVVSEQMWLYIEHAERHYHQLVTFPEPP